MGFSSALQGAASHDAILVRVDAELRLLENMKRCLGVRIKADREYAIALNSFVLQAAQKMENVELCGSFVAKAWSVFIDEADRMAKLVKENAETLANDTAEKLNSLYTEKKANRKQHQEEYSRLCLELHRLQELVHKTRNDYERCADNYAVSKAKYEEQYTKGKLGKRLDDCRDRYQKACRKLHLTHNEYILLLSEASEFERDMRTILLPGLLEYQQAVQEDMIDKWKLILQDIQRSCNLAGPRFQEMQSKVEKAVAAVKAAEEYSKFTEVNKTAPPSPVVFKFDETLLEGFESAQLSPSSVALDDLTIDSLKLRLQENDVKLQECRTKIKEKQTYIIQYDTELQTVKFKSDQTSVARMFAIKKKMDGLKKEVNELRCTEQKLIKQNEMIQTPIAELGCEQLPSGCDVPAGDDIFLPEATQPSEPALQIKTPPRRPPPFPQSNNSSGMASGSGLSQSGASQVMSVFKKPLFNSVLSSASHNSSSGATATLRGRLGSIPVKIDLNDHLSLQKHHDKSSQLRSSSLDRTPYDKLPTPPATTISSVIAGASPPSRSRNIPNKESDLIGTRSPSTDEEDNGGALGTGENGEEDDPAASMVYVPGKPLEEEVWFHGVLPRGEVVRLLETNGDFLLRETTRNEEKQIVLSVMWTSPKHFIVQTSPEGLFRFEGPAFSAVQELIVHQFRSGLPVTSRSGAILKSPVAREKWELNNDDVELVEKIGRGNFGDVYRANLRVMKASSANESLSKKVIKKVLSVAAKTCKVTLPEEQKKKFLQEGRILKQYDHPNIVKFIGICVQKQPIMILMELVPGGSLLNFLRNNGTSLTSRNLFAMCMDAAAGMQYLESKNCIHRDLAARNCLVGDNNIVKISDFGMSREEEEYIVSDGLKQIPIKWTAPEALNYGKYTSLCDVWSFGVLCWEVFSKGGTPYQGMTNTKAREMLDGGYRMPTPDGCPDEMYQLMLRCWQYEPEDRPHFKEIHSIIDLLYSRQSRRSVTFESSPLTAASRVGSHMSFGGDSINVWFNSLRRNTFKKLVKM